MKTVLTVLSFALCSAAVAGDYGSYAPSRLNYDQRSALGASSSSVPDRGVFVSMQQRFVKAKKDQTQHSTGYGWFPRSYKQKTESKSSPTAVAVGYVFSRDCWYAGATLSFETETRTHETSTQRDIFYNKIRNETYGLTLFGRLNTTNGYYVKGSGVIGYRHSKAKQSYLEFLGLGRDELQKGDVDRGSSAGLSVEFGKDFLLDENWGITPHLGFDYSYNQKSEYDFGFPGQIALGKIKWDRRHSLEIPLGVKLSKTAYYGPWAVTGFVDATFIASIGRRDVWHTGFSSRTADEWKVYGIGGGHYGGRLKGGFTTRYNERLTMGIDYTYEGRKRYNDHRVSATFGLAF